MLLNEISCESRAQNDQLARNGIAAAPGFTRSQKNLLLLFLLAAIQSEELSACLLTLVNNLIPSTGFQMKLLEYFIHLHPCKLHGYDIAITLVYRFQMLKQTRQLFLVRFIVLLARILVIDTDFLSQIGKDNLWIIILLRIVTLIFTLMDAPLTMIALRAELRRSVLLLSDDASSGAMLLQIRIDLFIAILLQPFVLFRWNRHITDQKRNSCILSGGQITSYASATITVKYFLSIA